MVPASIDTLHQRVTRSCTTKFLPFKVLLSLKKDSKFMAKPNLNDDIILPGGECHLISEEEFGNEITWFMKISKRH